VEGGVGAQFIAAGIDRALCRQQRTSASSRNQRLADFAMQLTAQHVEVSSPASWVHTACCLRRTSAGNGRAAPRSAPVPAFIPCGSRQTRPDMRSHLRSPEEMN